MHDSIAALNHDVRCLSPMVARLATTLLSLTVLFAANLSGQDELPTPAIVADSIADIAIDIGPARPWLDIRPRTLDKDDSELVSIDKLPRDKSGLEPQDSTAEWIQLYQADLQLRDIWPGASFCHRPLYYQDASLERCGTIAGPLRHCPSVHSAIHFAWKTGMLPASVAWRPPCRRVKSGCR